MPQSRDLRGKERTLDTIGLVLTVVGFVLTVAQAVRARRAADAARVAAEDVRHRVGDLMLSSLLPRLRAAEGAIRYARATNDHALATREIATWRDVLADVSGFLHARGLASNADDVLIAACTGFPDTSEEVLVERSTTVSEAVGELLREAGHLSGRLSQISAGLLMEVGDAAT